MARRILAITVALIELTLRLGLLLKVEGKIR